MKIKIIFYIICSTFILLACTGNPNTTKAEQAEVDLSATEETSAVKTKYCVMTLVDSIAEEYPNKFDNDIQEKKFANAVWDAIDAELKNDNTFLSDVPMQFSQMVQNGNKYILKFECGHYSTNDDNLESDASGIEINAAIYSEVSEDVASTLIDRSIYSISGKYAGKLKYNLTLPSGNVFEYPATFHKYSDDKYGTLCIGGYLFKDIQFKLLEKRKK